MSSIPVFMSDFLGFVAATQGYYLITWFQWSEGLAFLDPSGCQQLERKFVAHYHPQGTTHTAD